MGCRLQRRWCCHHTGYEYGMMRWITLLVWDPSFPPAILDFLTPPRWLAVLVPRRKGSTQRLVCQCPSLGPEGCMSGKHLLPPSVLGSLSPTPPPPPSPHLCLSGSESLLSFVPHLCRSVSKFLLVLCLLISESLFPSSVSQCPYPGVSASYLSISPHPEACSMEAATERHPPAVQTMGCR